MKKDIRKLKELTKDLERCMMTTITEEGKLYSRPMSVQEIDGEGNIWFFTHSDTDKIKEIRNEDSININYMGKNYVSIYGEAEIVEDDKLKKDKWTKDAKAWFQTSYDDPSIKLIKVNTESAEYWESEGAKTFLEIVTSMIKREEPNPGENKEIKL